MQPRALGGSWDLGFAVGVGMGVMEIMMLEVPWPGSEV
tara:strand:- start:424 stop:537 length:114 start_codon:yes stop_codon:yes gene_type:complete